MIQRRRLRILAAFFIIWAAAIITEIATFNLLGPQRALAFERLFSGVLFLLGISWQIIFQGPTPAEVMDQFRRRYGYKLCTIDRLYLRFNIDRTVRVIIVLTFWAMVGALARPRLGNGTLNLSGISALFAALAALRLLVIRTRVLDGLFGTTQSEARELLSFLRKLKDSSGAGFEPPSRMRPIPDALELTSFPKDAEIVL